MSDKSTSSWMQIRHLFTAAVAIGLLFAAMWFVGIPISVSEELGLQAIDVQAEQRTDEFSVYLPVITSRYPPDSVFGLAMDHLREGNRLNLVLETDTKWTRSADVDWSVVEPYEGERDWDALADTISQWQNATENGLTNIVVVDSTPSWAQKVPGYFCGPIRRDKLAAFADFMYDLVDRYNRYPYHVKYWEIWNEPDIDPTFVKPDSFYGCWGDKKDPYYGGEYYAEMLKVVYPKVKAADPTAKVLVGGLLLDCDPNNPPIGKDCTSSRFLEGILMNGGGPYFDGVSFHAYDYYTKLGVYANVNWDSYWNTSGPVVIAKAQFLKSVLKMNNVLDKFLINTEGALLCATCVEDAAFETTKAYYVTQSYATAIAEGLVGNLWYSFSGSGWRNTGMIDSSGSPLPAYDAYKFAARELISTELYRQIKEYPGVMGYVFDRDGVPIWVMWSLDGEDHAILLPKTPDRMYDVFGGTLPINQNITITIEPIYIEW